MRKPKPFLFFDFDDMMFETLSQHVWYLNDRYQIESVESDYHGNPSIETVLNKYLPEHKAVDSHSAYADLIQNFHQSHSLHESVVPVNGMVQIMNLLAEKYSIVGATARPKVGREVVELKYQEYIPGCISYTHFVWDHSPTAGFKGVPKKSFIETSPGRKIAFFDDSPTEIRSTQSVITSYLFDRYGRYDFATDIANHIDTWHNIGMLLL